MWSWKQGAVGGKAGGTRPELYHLSWWRLSRAAPESGRRGKAVAWLPSPAPCTLPGSAGRRLEGPLAVALQPLLALPQSCRQFRGGYKSAAAVMTHDVKPILFAVGDQQALLEECRVAGSLTASAAV